MRLAWYRLGEIGPPGEHALCDRLGHPGGVGEDPRGRLGVLDGPLAAVFVRFEHPPGVLGPLREGPVEEVQEAVGVVARLADEQLRPVVFEFGHVGVEPGPRVDIAADQGRLPLRVLEVDDLHVVFARPGVVERSQQEEVGVGAARGGDPPPLQARDRLDAGLFEGDQRGPLGLGVDVRRRDRHAVRAGHQRRDPGGQGDVGLAALRVLVRLVAPEAQHPLDVGAGVCERRLHPALLAQHETDWAVVRVVDRHRSRSALTSDAVVRVALRVAGYIAGCSSRARLHSHVGRGVRHREIRDGDAEQLCGVIERHIEPVVPL